jgi:hypothetical protein
MNRHNRHLRLPMADLLGDPTTSVGVAGGGRMPSVAVEASDEIEPPPTECCNALIRCSGQLPGGGGGGHGGRLRHDSAVDFWTNTTRPMSWLAAKAGA